MHFSRVATIIVAVLNDIGDEFDAFRILNSLRIYNSLCPEMLVDDE